TLDVFDLANGARIATVAVGAGLGVAVDPATRRVYVAGGTGPFAVVDGVTNSVVATRSVPSGQVWFAVALDPGMHRVYVSNLDHPITVGALSRRDAPGWKAVRCRIPGDGGRRFGGPRRRERAGGRQRDPQPGSTSGPRHPPCLCPGPRLPGVHDESIGLQI